MAKRKKNITIEDDMNVDLSPMIDMVFLLLIFFLVNANMIVVKMDKSVEVPVADASSQQEVANGRIVVNIYEDGTLKDANAILNFETEADLSNYIETQKDISKGLGYEPVLHLRGDRKTLFKNSRRVIKAASEAGVDNVKFASYQVNKY